MEPLPCVLTIAGSDSGGGAGIQADLKAISISGCYGASAITALTAQNTTGVAGIEPVTPEFVALQIETVCQDINIQAAKTGMLFSAPIIRAVAAALQDKDFPLVIDPVCVATSGAKLLKDDAVQAMKDLFPLADLLTPNVPEAELFTDMEIASREDIFKAIDILLEMGPKAVLIKGGHFDSVAATDWLGIKGRQPIPLMQQRVKTKNSHGTGCTLSATIASGLAKGYDMVAAVRKAQEYLNLALRASFDLGEGSGPPNHLAPMLIEQMKQGLLSDLHKCGRRLSCMDGLSQLVPEVRMNVVAALPHAEDVTDVAAFSGKITCTRKGEIIVSGQPEFGASVYMAKALICARKFNPEISCAVSLRHDADILSAIAACGYVEAWFDRGDEPSDIQGPEAATIEWGTCKAVAEHPEPELVDVVCDSGDKGREPLIRLLAKDFADLEHKIRKILESMASF
ncbi:bifunctional hydroxymethylpyrimidine kinase/phosphomethylpyrimidine kinase [Maridesulfovibrio hydrothermalis]|uniref:hydroxymethylpyrimidine kinase n=1 Tax=Maridesulfovibrio hydrothermalis AM13 = DSM 14728 TaxID=1121451 RepID=L0RD57_9BACT|nr:bifunctional hydroxymethylpyrimidine kinase/phosphomethylpyrimidine kinase [Maridesulfovibrio hydrothermalis]CCO24689.1 Phosphomethylpyrimidine kinase [Maridesulfovibrio hydrothermalis AM13 = DSM 14728]